MKKTLKVFASDEALVPDYEALEQGKLRFVGRYRVAEFGENGAWMALLEAVDVPFRAEYLQELKAGALIAGDQETANLARVPFYFR